MPMTDTLQVAELQFSGNKTRITPEWQYVSILVNEFNRKQAN